MKKELPHCSATLVFHFFYCRGKNIFLVINTYIFVLISTQKRQQGKLGIISLSVSFKAVQCLHKRATFYVKLTCCFYTISMKPYSFQHSVSCRETKSPFFISEFCFTLASVP